MDKYSFDSGHFDRIMSSASSLTALPCPRKAGFGFVSAAYMWLFLCRLRRRIRSVRAKSDVNQEWQEECALCANILCRQAGVCSSWPVFGSRIFMVWTRYLRCVMTGTSLQAEEHRLSVLQRHFTRYSVWAAATTADEGEGGG